MVVLTSDHGESLGDHGEATHGIFAYEATLRVPLILYYPPRLAPRVVDAAATHVDIVPTILDTSVCPPPAGLRGRSLARSARRPGPPRRVTYFEALSRLAQPRMGAAAGIVSNGMKYIDLPIPELYDLHADPGERATSPKHVRRSLRSTQAAAFVRESRGSAGRRDVGCEGATTCLGYVASSPRSSRRAYTERTIPNG